jgi:protein TonB
MKPEKILESDVLDIIFENRNKEYGAYELRKNYNKRAVKALGITALVVVAFGFMQSFKVPKKTGRFLAEGPIVNIAELPTQKVEEKVKEEPKEKEAAKEKTVNQPKAYAVEPFTPPLIVQENDIEPPPTNESLDNKAIGDKRKPGELGNPGDNITAPSGGNDKVGGTSIVPAAPAGPIYTAEVMPEFPGGKDAFLKFMQRNLQQPDDLEEGQKLVVIAKFVVNEQGEIVDIDISQNGRKDLDAEVMRVIKKMPRWKPGVQNGRNVSVYYKVPVTFVAP